MRSLIGRQKHRKNGWKPWRSCGKLSMDMIHLPNDFKEFLILLNDLENLPD